MSDIDKLIKEESKAESSDFGLGVVDRIIETEEIGQAVPAQRGNGTIKTISQFRIWLQDLRKDLNSKIENVLSRLDEMQLAEEKKGNITPITSSKPERD